MIIESHGCSKRPIFHPPTPGAPRRACHRALFSQRLDTQRPELAGGKVPIRSHLIETSGSSEAWYVPLRIFTCCGLASGRFEQPLSESCIAAATGPAWRLGHDTPQPTLILLQSEAADCTWRLDQFETATRS